MDINSVYSEIVEKLRIFNNPNVIIELENSTIGAATGSEGLALTGKYLFELKHKNPPVYKLIKEQIIEYLNYCEKNGIYIK